MTRKCTLNSMANRRVQRETALLHIPLTKALPRASLEGSRE
ncbi:hypothetical protein MNBD_ACTINO02-1323 [hydrothermal vent metagenome]|uniref:Uncharacterized protein n=1 Tax=hydrothermal vent metagenome TaxID=652676 RepID=A0A3B0SMK7_9ZZZZ